MVLETVTTEQADEEYKFAFKTDDEAAGLVEAIQVWPSPPSHDMRRYYWAVFAQYCQSCRT